MSPAKKPARARWLAVLLSLPFLIVAGAVALYALAGFVVAPQYLKSALPRMAQERLNARLEITDIRINPFLFKVDVKGLKLTDANGEPVLGWQRFFVDLDATGLLRWAWSFDEILLEQPAVTLQVDRSGKLNFAVLAQKLLALESRPQEQADEKNKPLPRALIREAAIRGGTINWVDNSTAQVFRYSTTDIGIELKDLSTLPEHAGHYTVAAKLAAGGTVSWRGDVSLTPVKSSGEIEVRGLRLAALKPYTIRDYRIQDPAGEVDVGLRYQFALEKDRTSVTADGISVRIHDMSVIPLGARQPVLQLKTLELNDGSFSLDDHKIAFAAARASDGRFVAAMDPEGKLNWSKLILTREPTAPAEKSDKKAEKSPAPAGSEKPWSIKVDEVSVDRLGISYTDESTLQPYVATIGKAGVKFAASAVVGGDTRISGLNARVEQTTIGAVNGKQPAITLSSAAVHGTNVDLVAQRAQIKAVEIDGLTGDVVRESDGSVNLAQLFAAKVKQPPGKFTAAVDKVTLRNSGVRYTDRKVPLAIELTDMQASVTGYAPDAKKPLQFDFATRVKQGGTIKTKGNYDLARQRLETQFTAAGIGLAPVAPILEQYVTLKLAGGSLSTSGRLTFDGQATPAAIRYIGSTSLDDLQLDAPDTPRFAGWKSLAVTRLRYDSTAGQLAVNDVLLQSPYGRIVVNKDRSTNLAALVKPQPAPQPAPANNTAPSGGDKEFAAVIERLRVEDAAIDFSDLSLVLPFATQIRNMSGAVTGLSSERGTRANVNLEGQVADYGLARVGGSINLFQPKQHTDLAVTFRNVALTPLSPYTATFAGRKIDSGRISLDLQYKIDNSELRGQNKVLLEQLKLGERVQSPTAVNLPLDLAIAVLTDSNGRINLAIPVSGNVDKPDFSYGHLVWQAITTVLTNIVTAPFRWLFGSGGDKVDDIAFDAGSDRLLPPEREKLANVSKTLSERQQLQIAVQGRYNTAEDTRALKELALQRLLAERLGVKLAPDERPGPPPLDNARIQRTLESLLDERGGKDAMLQLVANFEKQAKRPARRVNPVLGLAGRGSDDRDFYDAVYRRVIELQPLPPDALVALADRRGKAIIAALQASGLAPSRLTQGKPEATAEGITAKLSLQPAKS